MKRLTAPLATFGALFATALVLLPLRAGQAQDTALFANAVPPNVMMMVDNSGSMANLVWHPAFDPGDDPSCTTNWSFGDADNDTTYFFSSTFTTTQCGNERTLYADDTVTGSTRILGRYLNWYFSDEAEDYFKGTANNDADNIDSPANGQRSKCLTDEGLPSTYPRYRRSRITAAQEVLREVICNVNLAGDVRFGLAQFFTGDDPEGGYVAVPIDDYDAAQGALIDDFIDDLSAEAWTPLAETLYNVYSYFQSRDNPALGVDDEEFPEYVFDEDGDDVGASNALPSPVEVDCQKNFVVIITDGEPTKDDFDDMDPDEFKSLVGDYNTDNTSPEGAGGEEPNDTCGYCNETWLYLDDLAKYMHDTDFQLDFDGDQLIDIYTIGFTTSGPANDLLQKTAESANGFFRQSNNAEELATVLIEQIVDILQKSQSFTSATVPAARATHDNSFYSSYFRPKGTTPFWDGHLKAFKFTASGEILTADDKCAIGDDTLDPPCPSSGRLLTESNAVWDAAEEFPNPIDRNLTTGASGLSFGAGAQDWFATTPSFGQTQSAASLGLDSAPPAELTKDPYNLPNPSTQAQRDALVPNIVSQIAGCEYGTTLNSDCVTRTDEDGNVSVLGDIFHSNPVIVDSPNSRINQLTYKLFANTYRDRDRVILAGANDGWLHGFNAGEWDAALTPPRHDFGTGEEVLGFMPTEVRNGIWELPISQQPGTIRDYVAVDGSMAVADVWIYRTISGGQFTPTLDPYATTRVEEQWRTVLVGSLRNGGNSYYALDVTDPSDTGNYPRYLWDFPCQNCGVATNGGSDDAIVSGGPTPKQLMASTWSEPVITRVKVASNSGGAYERWVAIVGAGYDVCGDPNSIAYWSQLSSERCDASDADRYSPGRAIMMIDITTGELLGVKAFKPGGTSIDSDQTPRIVYPDLTYAMPSQPAVFDVDFDGYADVVYIGDLGGNVWKWVVSAVGDDPINNSTGNADLAQPNWPFERFFQADHSDSPNAATSSSHFQTFFFPLTATKKGSALIVAWGAGERNTPGAGTVDDPVDPSDNNHFYVVKDTDVKHRTGLATTLTEADLVDLGDVDAGTKSCADIANAKGYFMTSRDREKFLTNSVIFLGEVITGSYVPAEAGANICSAAGTAFQYRFDLLCGYGSYTNGSPEEDRRKAIGGGLPTRPRVSVGDLNDGGGGGGCDNKVVLITSDGEIENDCPGPLPTSGVNIRSWRNRQ